MTAEQDITQALIAYLTAQGNRIVCARGTFVVHDDGGRAVATLNAELFEIKITVQRRTP
jgi:hypothetical protein